MKKSHFLLAIVLIFSTFRANCQLTTSIEEYYKLDETTGQAVNSVNPGVNNSSSITATQGVSGKIGNAYSFDGVSQRIDFADHANWTITTTSSFSISVWIYLTADITSNGYGSLWGHQDGPQVFLLKSSAGKYKIGWYAGNNTPVYTSTLSFSFNTWYHIVISKSGSSVNIYRNGTNVGALTATDIDVNPSAVYIGADAHTSFEAFKGRIDELGIWKKALSPEEVSQLYNDGNGLTYPFSPINYTLSTIASPTTGGSVALSPSGGSYAPGTVVTVTAITNSGYTFVGWSGDFTGTTNPATVTMDIGKTINVTFNPAAWQTNGDNIYYSNGNVGIGTTSPSTTLTINGDILVKEVEVVSNITSDYVFEQNYKLMPLNDLELYLQQNKHLPEIPSAAKFLETGQDLGKMDDMLLRKIEELTLYIVELKKEIEELKKGKE